MRTSPCMQARKPSYNVSTRLASVRYVRRTKREVEEAHVREHGSLAKTTSYSCEKIAGGTASAATAVPVSSLHV